VRRRWLLATSPARSVRVVHLLLKVPPWRPYQLTSQPVPLAVRGRMVRVIEARPERLPAVLAAPGRGSVTLMSGDGAACGRPESGGLLTTIGLWRELADATANTSSRRCANVVWYVRARWTKEGSLSQTSLASFAC